MAENSIVGKCSSLPSTPGLTSSCEEKLLQLLTYVDFLLANKHEELKRVVEEANLKYEAMKEENQSLREMLEAKHIEFENVQYKHKEECEQHKNKVSNLQEEINKIKNEKGLKGDCSLCKEKAKAHEVEVGSLRKSVEELKKTVVDLKKQLNEKCEQKAQLEGSYSSLLKALSMQQSEMKNREEKRLHCILERLDEEKTTYLKEFNEVQEANLKAFEEVMRKKIDVITEKLNKAIGFC